MVPGEWTDRQRAYAQRLDGQVYTPELVVDGAKGMIGSEEGLVVAAVRSAGRMPKVTLSVEAAVEKGVATVRVGGGPKGILYVAAVHDEKRTEVTRGENAGRTLSHVGVVYGMVVTREREARVKVAGGSRIVAFIAEGSGGRVLAVGTARP